MSSPPNNIQWSCPTCTYKSTSPYCYKQHIRRCRYNSKQSSHIQPSSYNIIPDKVPITPPIPVTDLDRNQDYDFNCNTDFPVDDKNWCADDIFFQIICTILDIKRRSGGNLMNKLLHLFQANNFDFNNFRSKVRNIADCHKIVTKYTTSFFLNNGLRETPITTHLPSSQHVSSTLYLSNPVSVIERQLRALHHFDDIQYRPPFPLCTEPDQATNGPLHTPHFQSLYNNMRSHIISQSPDDCFWNDYAVSAPKSMVCFLQLFTDKTATSLSSVAYTAYPIHIVVLNTNPERREWLINNGLTILGFLPATTSSPTSSSISLIDGDDTDNLPPVNDTDETPYILLDDDIELTSDTAGRETSMLVLQNCLKRCLTEIEAI